MGASFTYPQTSQDVLVLPLNYSSVLCVECLECCPENGSWVKASELGSDGMPTHPQLRARISPQEWGQVMQLLDAAQRSEELGCLKSTVGVFPGVYCCTPCWFFQPKELDLARNIVETVMKLNKYLFRARGCQLWFHQDFVGFGKHKRKRQYLTIAFDPASAARYAAMPMFADPHPECDVMHPGPDEYNRVAVEAAAAVEATWDAGFAGRFNAPTVGVPVSASTTAVPAAAVVPAPAPWAAPLSGSGSGEALLAPNSSAPSSAPATYGGVAPADVPAAKV